MTNLTQKSQTSQKPEYFDGYFDASTGQPPKTDKLGSPYFSGYITAVAKTGQTPF